VNESNNELQLGTSQFLRFRAGCYTVPGSHSLILQTACRLSGAEMSLLVEFIYSKTASLCAKIPVLSSMRRSWVKSSKLTDRSLYTRWRGQINESLDWNCKILDPAIECWKTDLQLVRCFFLVELALAQFIEYKLTLESFHSCFERRFALGQIEC
jgi:hypothetical protein